MNITNAVHWSYHFKALSDENFNDLRPKYQTLQSYSPATRTSYKGI